MSWLELDDGILDHPKFIRAVKQGGSEAVHLWLGMRAYCGKLLTDGVIPADMIDEIRGPGDKKRRVNALAALIDAGLLHKLADGSVEMHDYLEWSSSKEDVAARRKSWRDNKRKSRDSDPLVLNGLHKDSPGSPGSVLNGLHKDSPGSPGSVLVPRARVPSDPIRSPSDPIPVLTTPEESERSSPAEIPVRPPDPLTTAGLILLAKIVVGARRPGLGLYQPGQWAAKAADTFLEAIPPDKRTDATRDEIRAKIAAFAECEDIRITKGTYSVQAFCDGYNAIGASRPARKKTSMELAQEAEAASWRGR